MRPKAFFSLIRIPVLVLAASNPRSTHTGQCAVKQPLSIGCRLAITQAIENWRIEPARPTAPATTTDWVRAQELQQFQGKSPQLFEGDIETSDLCQGAVGDCWLVLAFACASEFPDTIRHIHVLDQGIQSTRLLQDSNL
jgi:hypothetical protein